MDRSQEETERQERCARGKAWNLARNIYKLKEKDKSYILFVYRRVDDAGRIHHETGGKRVCGRFRREYAYGQQERDFNSAELETMRISKNPTTVMTANGEVQTREEATEDVKRYSDAS